MYLNKEYFLFKKITVTLEDVSCLWGLPISGAPVTGFTDGMGMRDRVYDLLGIREDEIENFMKKRSEKTSDWIMRKKTLRERFKRLPAAADEQMLKWLVFFSY